MVRSEPKSCAWFCCYCQARRRHTRHKYLAKKFYRRYLGVGPAEAQRRALNASFASSPKTTLMQEYDVDLNHVAYVNVFDKVSCCFQTFPFLCGLKPFHEYTLICVSVSLHPNQPLHFPPPS